MDLSLSVSLYAAETVGPRGLQGVAVTAHAEGHAEESGDRLGIGGPHFGGTQH